jgi:hypothetical protein
VGGLHCRDEGKNLERVGAAAARVIGGCRSGMVVVLNANVGRGTAMVVQMLARKLGVVLDQELLVVVQVSCTTTRARMSNRGLLVVVHLLL